MNKNETSWSVVFLALFGGVVLIVGSNIATWYIAHALSAWVFVLIMSGFSVAYVFAKEIVKELRK